MSYGPHPWQQTSWDWRAAGNFMAGGAGAGLLVASALLAPPAVAQPWAPNWQVLAGLGLVGLGLLCVWLEIGRPARALHVFFNPQTSWMSREAFVALLLFPAGLLVLLGLHGWSGLSALLALAFLYCQSRMLPAARGIPAWRPALLTPLVLVTGLCEGCALLALLDALLSHVANATMAVLALLLLARFVFWSLYRSAVDASLAARARSALNRAGLGLLLVGTLTPLVLMGLSTWLSGTPQAVLCALAGVAAALSGAYFKYTLITRASFNQGFALTQLPVRGVRANL